jgi:hypothetical protein
MRQWTSEEVDNALVKAAQALETSYPSAQQAQQAEPEDRRVKGTLGKSTDRRPPQRNENSQVTRQDRAGSFLTRQEALDAADGILPEGKIFAVDGVPLRELVAGPIWMEHGAGTPRVAVRGEYYHVAPARYRDSILQHGLQGQQFTKTHSPWDSLGGPMRAKQPHGNYLSDNPYEAYTYVHGLKQRGRFPGAHDWNDHDWYQYGVQPHEYGETSYVDGPVEDQPAEWDDWDHDQRMQWYDEQDELHGDGAAVPYEGPHQLTERGVDPALHGWDIWKVNVDPDKHQVLNDPEDAIHWRGDKEDRHPSMAEAIHNRWHDPEDKEPYADESMLDPQHDQYEEGSSLRWYVPQGIDPQYLQCRPTTRSGPESREATMRYPTPSPACLSSGTSASSPRLPIGRGSGIAGSSLRLARSIRGPSLSQRITASSSMPWATSLPAAMTSSSSIPGARFMDCLIRSIVNSSSSM